MQKTNTRALQTLLSLCAALGGAGPSLAQDGDLVLEEVLVTATRRVENLQDVAMSVSAFTNDFLQDSGVHSLVGLEQYTPNLKITPGPDSRTTSFRIRGIGSAGSNSGIDPSVGVFIDGIYQGRAGMSIADLVDVERVEILRGPQGTLYGKNTAAGAISIITRQPSLQFESLLEMSYDSNELLELRGMVNIPFGDTGHALRLSGFALDGDPLYQNTFTGRGVNNVDKKGARARLLLDLEGATAGEGLGEFILSADYTEENTHCCAFAVMQYDGLSPLNSPAVGSLSAQWQAMLGLNAQGQPILRYKAFEDSEGFTPPQTDPFGDDYWFDGPLQNAVEIGGAALEWNRDLDNGSALTFLNAWRFYESDSAYDGDFTAYDAAIAATEVDLDQYSSELRINSPGNGTLDGQAGLYGYYSEFDSVGLVSQSKALVNNMLIVGDLTLGDLLPDGSVNVDSNRYTTTSYAAFGQVTWNASEALSLTLGLRYTWERKEREGSQITTPEFFLDIPPIAGPDLYYDNQRTDSDLSPSLNVRYFFNPDVMTYAAVSRGFKSGGYDQRRQAQGQTGEFDQEIATNYELGWKTSWANRRLQFNGTLFLVNYDDFQSQSFDGASVRVTNAGDMRSYGSELELVFLPLPGMTIGSAIGYNKAEYEAFDNGQCTIDQTFYQYYVVGGAQGGSPSMSSVCTQDLAGQPLDNAPEWNISSFLQYRLPLFDHFEGILRLEHTYIDEYFLDQDLDPHLQNDAVNLVNLRLTLSNPAGTWEASVWGRNMLDEEYYAWGLDIPTLGGFAGVVAPMASYGITLRLNH
jgi:iron complex outermembrane recepter protein